jgi:sulfur-oxidizing protein SoxB
VLESVADNLFNPTPTTSRAATWCAVGGFRYKLDPTAAMGSRVSEMTLASGKAMDDKATYKVAGWATCRLPVAG